MGYGGAFSGWINFEEPKPYNSWGNGSAMRVSSVGWLFNSLEEVEEKARWTAEVTHNHPEGIKGAQATASAIFLARTGNSKEAIKKYITERYEYDLDRTVQDIKDSGYSFEDCCQRSVPEAIICFLDSTNFEDAIRNAISIGGDADTQACIAGSIAEAFYKDIPDFMIEVCRERLEPDFLEIIDKCDKYLKTGELPEQAVQKKKHLILRFLSK